MSDTGNMQADAFGTWPYQAVTNTRHQEEASVGHLKIRPQFVFSGSGLVEAVKYLKCFADTLVAPVPNRGPGLPGLKLVTDEHSAAAAERVVMCCRVHDERFRCCGLPTMASICQLEQECILSKHRRCCYCWSTRAILPDWA